MWCVRLAMCLVLTTLGCEPDPAPTPETQDSSPGDSEPTDSEEPSLLGCEDPQPIGETGYVRCADGAINRSEVKDVVLSQYTTRQGSCPEEKAGMYACSSDADCNARPNGHCKSFWTGFVAVCDCVYLCGSDSDCNAGQVCIPPGAAKISYPECFPAGCTQDSDCESGECGVGSASDGEHRTAGLACRDEYDECHGDFDCNGAYCLTNTACAQFTCQGYLYYD